MSLLDQFSLKGKTAVGNHRPLNRTVLCSQLEDTIPLLTGGARGLGLEMMRAFAEVGASVACIDVLPELGKHSVNDIHRDFGVLATTWECDVTDDEQVRTTFDAIAKKHGSINVLVTAAGVVKNFRAEQYPAADFRRLMDVNVNGTFFCAQAAGNHMIAQATGGSIILIASMSGSIVNRPQPQCAYNASKGAVIMLAKSLATEWAPRGIRVNSLSPGYMETGLTKALFEKEGENGPVLKATWEGHTPIGRIGKPHELKAMAVYLASSASSFVTGELSDSDGRGERVRWGMRRGRGRGAKMEDLMKSGEVVRATTDGCNW
ncbi:NAD(P)-binding protein [Jimgerdemannia flammicorona]|uniref:D-arabinitol 2-dehydrogenase [ribulose-forming] n=1 Tax=Jimgerdemannia flammicorona TaxID=994334 RepID=A0A433D793_9FUNG|nr:NAD(P)-binding protein [Jimgerdemannia flammicorona]